MGTRPNLKRRFYEQNLASRNQVKVSESQEDRGKATEGVEQAHTKNGAVLLQNVAPTPSRTNEHSGVQFF